ncbi:MAG: thiosulfate sulfurtransferase [Alphaproteobacteria bacterium]|nr:thiosulfate sulfurtransferase [Alphaproteobacteria bacterium]
MPRSISPAEVKALIRSGGEFAILDAREDGEFGTGHLYHASCVSQAQFELRARALVPRKGAPIVVTCGNGGALSASVAGKLEALGYSNVAILAGGVPAWQAAGYELFTGVNVPSKAFGEYVEHHYHTPSVSAEELKSMMDQGRDLVVLDSRPLEEFRRMSIPRGVNVPGGELVYRYGDVVPGKDTLVVVNCAGRTRSILGAQSLRNAGVPNQVVALRNGTMGWELAGYACDRGQTRRYPSGTPAGIAAAKARAEAVAKAHGVKTIDMATLRAWQADPGRSLFLLDVRDPNEYRDGHLPGSRSAPGGQLVQQTDVYVGVWNARIVLVDDTGVRAAMTAHWLRQMGHHDTYVLQGGLEAGEALETGPWRPVVPELAAIPVEGVSPAELAAMLDAKQATAVDLGQSLAFRQAHIPGAHWGVRGRLARLKDRLPGAGGTVVLTSPDGIVAHLAVPEMRALTPARVMLLQAGTDAWVRNSFDTVGDRRVPTDEECIDFYLRPYDRNSGVEEAMKAYLSWEIDLVKQIERDGDIHYGTGH